MKLLMHISKLLALVVFVGIFSVFSIYFVDLGATRQQATKPYLDGVSVIEKKSKTYHSYKQALTSWKSRIFYHSLYLKSCYFRVHCIWLYCKEKIDLCEAIHQTLKPTTLAQQLIHQYVARDYTS